MISDTYLLRQHCLTLLIVEREIATCTCNVNVCNNVTNNSFDAFCVSHLLSIQDVMKDMD
jgi:hypothetical protein